jgi:hypothetical protein
LGEQSKHHTAASWDFGIRRLRCWLAWKAAFANWTQTDHRFDWSLLMSGDTCREIVLIIFIARKAVELAHCFGGTSARHWSQKTLDLIILDLSRRHPDIDWENFSIDDLESLNGGNVATSHPTKENA